MWQTIPSGKTCLVYMAESRLTFQTLGLNFVSLVGVCGFLLKAKGTQILVSPQWVWPENCCWGDPTINSYVVFELFCVCSDDRVRAVWLGALDRIQSFSWRASKLSFRAEGAVWCKILLKLVKLPIQPSTWFRDRHTGASCSNQSYLYWI